jgi:hypothetical protein
LGSEQHSRLNVIVMCNSKWPPTLFRHKSVAFAPTFLSYLLYCLVLPGLLIHHEQAQGIQTLCSKGKTNACRKLVKLSRRTKDMQKLRNPTLTNSIFQSIFPFSFNGCDCLGYTYTI